MAQLETSEDIKKYVSIMITFCLKRDNTLMRNQNIDEYKQVCMREFIDFHQKYPTLFFSIIENPSTFPLYRLNEMLEIKSKIDNNEIEEQKASIHIGQKYYDEFVKDTVTYLDSKK
jgi:hypothetical protein